MCYTFKNIKFYKLILLLTNEPFTQIYQRLTWNLSAEGKKILFKDRRKRWSKKRIQMEVLFPHYFAWLGSIMHKPKNFYCQSLYSCAEFAIGRNCLVCLSVWRGWKLVLLWFFIFKLSEFTSLYPLTSSLDFPSSLKLSFLVVLTEPYVWAWICY